MFFFLQWSGLSSFTDWFSGMCGVNCVPAVPDVHTRRSQVQGTAFYGIWWWEEALCEHVTGEGQVSIRDSGSNTIKIQQVGRVSSHGCMRNLR